VDRDPPALALDDGSGDADDDRRELLTELLHGRRIDVDQRLPRAVGAQPRAVLGGQHQARDRREEALQVCARAPARHRHRDVAVGERREELDRRRGRRGQLGARRERHQRAVQIGHDREPGRRRQ